MFSKVHVGLNHLVSPASRVACLALPERQLASATKSPVALGKLCSCLEPELSVNWESEPCFWGGKLLGGSCSWPKEGARRMPVLF